MPIVYASSLKSTRMQAVISAIDAQSSAGVLEIGTSGMALVLVAITLAKPSFTLNNDTISLPATRSGTASTGGSAAAGRIKDGAGSVIVSGLTVDMAGADIILNSTGMSPGDSITLTSATITHG